MANPELGTKQVCPQCQSKFYDLNKRPAHCPKCGADFDPEEAVRNRRVRARAITPDTESDEDAEDQVVSKESDADEEEDDEATTPELDEGGDEPPISGDDDDDAEPTSGGDDLSEFSEDDEEDSDSDDVPFLEEEDDDFDDSEIDGLGEDGEEDR